MFISGSYYDASAQRDLPLKWTCTDKRDFLGEELLHVLVRLVILISRFLERFCGRRNCF